MPLTAGVARTRITPPRGVELTGWGYYLERRWEAIRDPLHATALVLDDGETTLAIVALDLMVIDAVFTRRTRERVFRATGIPPDSVLLACSHTHSAPAAGGLRGVGACDPGYEDLASRWAADAVTRAWRERVEARLGSADTDLPGLTFNRTREAGPVDRRLTTLRVDRSDGRPLAVMIGFQAHPTVYTALFPHAISRDVPGEICDRVEAAFPGVTALYLQGACGDVNFSPEFSTPERAHEPALRLAEAAVRTRNEAETTPRPGLAVTSRRLALPTRRWRPEEVHTPLEEARRRRSSGDLRNWREGIGRVMTNRPDDMVRRHGGDERRAVLSMARFVIEWAELALRDLETRPESLETEIQVLRIGGLLVAANASELFSAFALDLRERGGAERLMIASYANGRIGYLPDAHDIEARSYAAYQSPKYCDQFPFTVESGPRLVEGTIEAMRGLLR